MVYLITKQLKWPLERSSYDGSHVVGRATVASKERHVIRRIHGLHQLG